MFSILRCWQNSIRTWISSPPMPRFAIHFPLEPVTRIGLPETQLGLLPAWGGSSRLPRLIGLAKALDVILAGKVLGARQALRYGMVDELAPRECLLAVARRKIEQGKPRRATKL